jgi:hypothetical protein
MVHSASCDGVRDDGHSFAFDGSRELAFHNAEEVGMSRRGRRGLCSDA